MTRTRKRPCRICRRWFYREREIDRLRGVLQRYGPPWRAPLVRGGFFYAIDTARPDSESSTLKERIKRIMTNRIANNLDLRGKALLATVWVAAVAGPIAIGLMSAPQGRAQSPDGTSARLEFEVASIKIAKPGGIVNQIRPLPGGQTYLAQDMTVKAIFALMYKVPDSQVS